MAAGFLDLSTKDIINSFALVILALSINNPIAEKGHSIRFTRLKNEE